MIHHRIRVLAVPLALAAALTAAGCGDGDDSAAPTSATSSAAGPPGGAAAPDSADNDTTTIDVTIADGQVTPHGARIDATVGTPIVLYVTSDTDDELHIHSSPEHSFGIHRGDTRKRFEFTVTVPGSVAVELHEADVTVATLQVR